MIGTVGVTMGLLMGCSAPDKPVERLQKGDLIMPVYAEGFRWRTCGGGPDAEATCLEILDGDKKAVSVTVYRDSVHWQYDEAFVPGAAVVLGLEHGLTTLSSTHVALMEPWDASLSQWKGGGFLQYVESEAAKKRMRDGEIVDFGGNPEWNHEAMIASSFRAFCIYPYGNPLQGEEWAESLPVVPILEYAERTSLGRAEWMKVFAWMVDDQALERANEAFDEITDRYQQIQQEPLPTSDSLRVFTGSVDQGKWTAPSGNSFIAHILRCGCPVCLCRSEESRKHQCIPGENHRVEWASRCMGCSHVSVEHGCNYQSGFGSTKSSKRISHPSFWPGVCRKYGRV